MCISFKWSIAYSEGRKEKGRMKLRIEWEEIMWKIVQIL